MDTKTRKHLFRLTLIVVFLPLAITPALGPVTPAIAQSGEEYQLTWFTLGGGGGMSSPDGAYALSATAGEPATGGMNNGDFSLESGFWGGALDLLNYLYLPAIQKH